MSKLGKLNSKSLPKYGRAPAVGPHPSQGLNGLFEPAGGGAAGGEP